MTFIKPKADVPVALPPHKASDSKDPNPLSKDRSQWRWPESRSALIFRKTVSSIFCQTNQSQIFLVFFVPFLHSEKGMVF